MDFDPYAGYLGPLKAQNTDREANSVVSDKYSEVTSTNPMVFVRIVSGILVNCVSSIFPSLASALEIEKRRLQEYVAWVPPFKTLSCRASRITINHALQTLSNTGMAVVELSIGGR